MDSATKFLLCRWPTLFGWRKAALSSLIVLIGRGDASPTGSETVARYQMDIMGTRETKSVLLTGVCPIKPINGKMVQMTLWELRSILIKLFKSLTDQFIVPEKRANACRGKGPAGTHHLYP